MPSTSTCDRRVPDHGDQLAPGRRARARPPRARATSAVAPALLAVRRNATAGTAEIAQQRRQIPSAAVGAGRPRSSRPVTEHGLVVAGAQRRRGRGPVHGVDRRCRLRAIRAVAASSIWPVMPLASAHSPQPARSRPDPRPPVLRQRVQERVRRRVVRLTRRCRGHPRRGEEDEGGQVQPPVNSCRCTAASTFGRNTRPTPLLRQPRHHTVIQHTRRMHHRPTTDPTESPPTTPPTPHDPPHHTRPPNLRTPTCHNSARNSTEPSASIHHDDWPTPPAAHHAPPPDAEPTTPPNNPVPPVINTVPRHPTPTTHPPTPAPHTPHQRGTHTTPPRTATCHSPTPEATATAAPTPATHSTPAPEPTSTNHTRPGCSAAPTAPTPTPTPSQIPHIPHPHPQPPHPASPPPDATRQPLLRQPPPHQRHTRHRHTPHHTRRTSPHRTTASEDGVGTSPHGRDGGQTDAPPSMGVDSPARA